MDTESVARVALKNAHIYAEDVLEAALDYQQAILDVHVKTSATAGEFQAAWQQTLMFLRENSQKRRRAA